MSKGGRKDRAREGKKNEERIEAEGGEKEKTERTKYERADKGLPEPEGGGKGKA